MGDRYDPALEITELLENVKKAATELSNDVRAEDERRSRVARKNLQLEVRKLLFFLDEPNSEVWPRTFQVSLRLLKTEIRNSLTYAQINVSAAIEIVSQLGLWEMFAGGKSLSVQKIVEFTKADDIIIGYSTSSDSCCPQCL